MEGLQFLKQNNEEEEEEEEFLLCVTFALFVMFYLHSLHYHIVLQLFAYRSLFLSVPWVKGLEEYGQYGGSQNWVLFQVQLLSEFARASYLYSLKAECFI